MEGPFNVYIIKELYPDNDSGEELIASQVSREEATEEVLRTRDAWPFSLVWAENARRQKLKIATPKE